MRGLKDKVALISGGARGMGEAHARRLAAEGARVVIGDILADEAKALAGELGDGAVAISLDVTNAEQWAEAVAFAEQEFGRLDVLINNAGILGFAGLVEMSLEDYRRIIEVNQVGVFLGMQAAVPALERAGGGSIVNISSVEGLGGGPFLTAYTASKFAVRGMSKAAAIELGRKNIRVNSVHPGAILTEMVKAVGGGTPEAIKWTSKQIPLRRMGSADEVAGLVAFLASDDASYCTGGEFVVDGGATADSGFKV